MGSIRTAILALILTLASGSVGAYERDTHYYLRFGLALATCFDWSESHLIASGDWGLDENGSTVAEMNPVQRRQKIAWHAFGHSDARFGELWQRTLQQEDVPLRMVQLGQFMHFLEDWESHAGYGVRMGHARDTFRGRDPDSFGRDTENNLRMIQSTLDHLLQTCADLGREADPERELVRLMRWIRGSGLIEEMRASSDPSWKKGKAGGFRLQGPGIVSTNKARVEMMIAAMPQPPGLPDDFEPGHAERGLPDSLGLRFDRDGGLLDSGLGAMASRARNAAPRPDVSTDIVESRINSKGWRVRVDLMHTGAGGDVSGKIELLVVDADDLVVHGESSTDVRGLKPGERRKLWIQIPAPAGGRPDEDVMVGAWFHGSDDVDASNDMDWWMSEAVAQERPGVDPTDDIDKPAGGYPDASVRLVRAPRILVDDSVLCMVVTALTPGGDSSQRLGRMRAILRTDEKELWEIDATELSLWSAVSTPESLVAGKSISCVELNGELCSALFAPGNGPLRLQLNVPAVDAKEWEGTLYTDRALPGQLHQACSQFATNP